MPVNTVSAVAFAKVTEVVDTAQGAGNANTTTATTVSATTTWSANGLDGTVGLDFTISSHEIAYGDRQTADSTSAKETRTVRQHEYSHVGARNALASKTLLKALCDDVKVQWTCHVAANALTGNPVTDAATQAAAAKPFEDAIEDYINPIIDYLDELVVHETQRNAGKVGVKTAAQVATMLAAISYTDPVSSTTNTPSTTVMGQAVAATKAGGTKGETHAKTTPTPAAVKPAKP
jgi:hypothetical protein